MDKIQPVAPVAWPPTGLVDGRLLVDSGDEQVWQGLACATRVPMIVSLRDVGPDAGAWAPALDRLSRIAHPAAAPLVDASVVDDRFFVIATMAIGETVHSHLAHGPQDADAMVAIALAALDVTEALHALDLSAAGLRLASATVERPADAPVTACITTYGLHVDRPIDVVRELREVALRVLSLAGATQVDHSLVVPPHVMPTVVAQLLREAAGLVPGHTLASAAALAAALRVAAHRLPRLTPTGRAWNSTDRLEAA